MEQKVRDLSAVSYLRNHAALHAFLRRRELILPGWSQQGRTLALLLCAAAKVGCDFGCGQHATQTKSRSRTIILQLLP
jgi:hypothetical protein